MATVTAPPRFGLVHAVYDARTLLLTQAAQVRCLRNTAAHLEPGGRFVAEVFVPRLQRLPPGETARPSRVSEHHLVVDVYDEPPACAAPSGGRPERAPLAADSTSAVSVRQEPAG